MNKALIALFAAVFSLGLVVSDAEAARVGGGRSSGMQRSVTPKSPAAPAQNAVPAKPAQAQPAAAPQPSGMSRWLGPIAGLAAGIGLAAMLSHFGLGEGFASIVMMLLIGMAVFFVRSQAMCSAVAALPPLPMTSTCPLLRQVVTTRLTTASTANKGSRSSVCLISAM